MPTKLLPLDAGSVKVAEALDALEAANNEVIEVFIAGDGYIIRYRKKVGRPPKMETR